MGRVVATNRRPVRVTEAGFRRYSRRMVRPDEPVRRCLSLARAVSRCIEPADGGSVPVGAGAPGSRPQAEGEIPPARAGRREPLRREQARGPQRYVNAAASTEKQRESRAAHVTAKAMSCRPVPERRQGLPGVRAVARAQGSMRNRRGPSARPGSGQGVSNKPGVKSSRCAAGVRGDRSTEEAGATQRRRREGSLRWSCRRRRHVRGHGRALSRFQLPHRAMAR